jgi:hypothetical protein
MKVDTKYYDEIFEFKGLWEVDSKCGLRVIRKGEQTYVIATELYQDNPGTSVTAACHSLVCQICEAKGLDWKEITYLECNPNMDSKLTFYDEEYFEVNFSDTYLANYRMLEQAEVTEMLGD